MAKVFIDSCIGILLGLFLTFTAGLPLTGCARNSPSHSVEFVGVEGHPNLDPVAINDSGQVLFQEIRNVREPTFTIRTKIWKEGSVTEVCPECVQVHASDLNNRGEVVGQYFHPQSRRFHPYYWSGEKGLVDLFKPEMVSATDESRFDWLTGINDRGQILLQRDTVLSASHTRETTFTKRQHFPSFLVTCSSESFKYESLPEGVMYSDLNNHGVVLGNTRTGPSLFSQGSTEDISIQLTGAERFMGTKINDQGNILGIVAESEDEFISAMYEFGISALWSREQGVRRIGTVEDGQSYSFNASTTVVGAYVDSRKWPNAQFMIDALDIFTFWLPSSLFFSEEGIIRPWIWRNETLEGIDHLLPRGAKWSRKGIVDINNKGQILGVVEREGNDVLVILSPIPPTQP